MNKGPFTPITITMKTTIITILASTQIDDNKAN